MATPLPVPARPAAPPRYSLLAAAQGVDDPNRWQAGIAWEPEGCGTGDSAGINCSPFDADRAGSRSDGPVTSWPFLVWASDECSTFSTRDWQGRARRALEASQSHQIAAEMWTGAITKAQADTPSSPFLADSSTITGSAQITDLRDVALLEAWGAACSQGQRLMIHMSPYLFLRYVEAAGDAVQPAGNLIVTALGNLVVTDSGYPGTGPDGEDPDSVEWAYVSTLVQVRLDTVEMLPRSLTDARDLASAVNRADNTITVWAQRLAAYQLDPCCRFAVQTNVPRPTIPT